MVHAGHDDLPLDILTGPTQLPNPGFYIDLTYFCISYITLTRSGHSKLSAAQALVRFPGPLANIGSEFQGSWGTWLLTRLLQPVQLARLSPWKLKPYHSLLQQLASLGLSAREPAVHCIALYLATSVPSTCDSCPCSVGVQNKVTKFQSAFCKRRTDELYYI